MRPSRPAAAVLTALALGATVLPAAARPLVSTSTLVLQLSATPPTPLADLGHRVALPRAERSAQLRALLPAAQTRLRAEDAARGLGLQVVGGDAGSVRVSGPTAVVDRVFPHVDDRAGAVRRTPPELAGPVTLVVDADDTRPVARPHATFTGEDFTTAYAAPVPGGYPRTRPALTDQTPIIATLQLSGWDHEALTRFAHDAVFTGDPGYDPVASGQYTAVEVSHAERFAAGDNDDADGEVGLDQEALLAVAPTARQRAYFASNSAQGYLGVLNRVLEDVTVRGLPIVAFSTSWGGCEQSYSPTFLVQLEDVLGRLNAAGVTSFAASGDDGAADCKVDGNTEPAVDYPASSPEVVGVGGTSHPNGSAAPAPDTAWSAPERGRGTGGGFSQIFRRPSWQALAGIGQSRQVPDLALVADLNTGFAIFTTDSNGAGGRALVGPLPVGGTSLSAPFAAAMLTNTLTARGFPGAVRGIGDVHRQLYAAALSVPGAFTDVVTARNDPPTIQAPGPGYDRATGLGTPNWSVLAPALFAAAPPPPAPPTVVLPALSTGATTLSLSSPGAVAGYYAGTEDLGCRQAPLGARPTLQLPEGVRKVYVRVLSRALVCSNPQVVVATVPRDDRKSVRSRGWSLRGNRAAFAGTYLEATAAGSTLSWTVTGRTFRVLLDKQRNAGLADLLLDGRVVRRLDLTDRTTRWAALVQLAASRGGRHTIGIRVLGRPGRGSTGTAVRIDGLVTVG